MKLEILFKSNSLGILNRGLCLPKPRTVQSSPRSLSIIIEEDSFLLCYYVAS